MKTLAVAALSVLAVAAAGCGGDDDSGLDLTGPAQIRIEIEQQNESGESGTATLFVLPNRRTRVTLELNGMPHGGVQPAHIHQGTCDDLEPQPAYGLAAVRERTNGIGRSATTVAVGVEELQSGEHAINVHRSNQALGQYVACGEIPSP
jgi:hypothetical protein